METLPGQKRPAAGIQDQQIASETTISNRISNKKLKMEPDVWEQVQTQGVIPEVEMESGTSGEVDDRYSEESRQAAEAPLEVEKYVSIEEEKYVINVEHNNVPDEITHVIPDAPDDDTNVPAQASRYEPDSSELQGIKEPKEKPPDLDPGHQVLALQDGQVSTTATGSPIIKALRQKANLRDFFMINDNHHHKPSMHIAPGTPPSCTPTSKCGPRQTSVGRSPNLKK